MKVVDEAGELRQLLGLGEAVSHSTSQGSIHRNTKWNRFSSVTLILHSTSATCHIAALQRGEYSDYRKKLWILMVLMHSLGQQQF